MKRRWRAWVWGIMTTLAGLSPCWADTAPATFTVRGPDAAQNRAFGHDLERLSNGRWTAVEQGGAMIVALGGGAFRATLEVPGHPPVLGVAVNRSIADAAVKPGCHCTAIWRGVPLPAQIQVLRALDPAAATVGVLLGPNSAWEPPPPHLDGVALEAVWVDNPGRLAEQLRQHLPDWDALLLPEDETLFNADSAKLILLTSYRQRVPVFGPDEGYVRAGSVASAYASTDDMARATVARLQDWHDDGRPPPPGFAGRYSPAVNEHVAHAYDLTIGDRAGLQRTLETGP